MWETSGSGLECNHTFACPTCFKCRPPWPHPEGQIWIRRVHEEMMPIACNHTFACSASFKRRLTVAAARGTDLASAFPRGDDNSYPSGNRHSRTKTVDDLGEKGAPLRSIAVVTTMSWRVVPRLVTWYTATGNSIPSARTMGRDAEQESCITTRRDPFLLCSRQRQ